MNKLNYCTCTRIRLRRDRLIEFFISSQPGFRNWLHSEYNNPVLMFFRTTVKVVFQAAQPDFRGLMSVTVIAIKVVTSRMNGFKPEQLPADLHKLIEHRELANGQILFYEGDRAQTAFWLKTGQLRLLHYTPCGQAVSHCRVRAGESFAEVSLFMNVYDCTAIAETASQVDLLPKWAVLEALRQNPDLAEIVMKQLACQLHQIKVLLDLRSIRSARDRVLHFLKLSVDRSHNRSLVQLDQPMKKLAEDLALTPEALSRAFTQLEAEQIISRQKRTVRFL